VVDESEIVVVLPRRATMLVSRGGRIERRVADDCVVAVGEEAVVVGVVKEGNKCCCGVQEVGCDDARGPAVTLSMLPPSSGDLSRCRRCADFVVSGVVVAVDDDEVAAAVVADDAAAAALPIGATSSSLVLLVLPFFELAKDFTDAGLVEVDDDEVPAAELPVVLLLSFLVPLRMVMRWRGEDDDAADAAVASRWRAAAGVVEKEELVSSSLLLTSLLRRFRCCCCVAAVAPSARRESDTSQKSESSSLSSDSCPEPSTNTSASQRRILMPASTWWRIAAYSRRLRLTTGRARRGAPCPSAARREAPCSTAEVGVVADVALTELARLETDAELVDVMPTALMLLLPSRC